mmetsp:Transcript_29191/g.89796  ORF Transcript_29191/g.89796 Transcript_29191/m.89796 type:complete len:247 (-) Transcript_29191:39-779(-)
MAPAHHLPGDRGGRARHGRGHGPALALPQAHEEGQRLDPHAPKRGGERADAPHDRPFAPQAGPALPGHGRRQPRPLLLVFRPRLPPLAALLPPLRGLLGRRGREDLHAPPGGDRRRAAAHVRAPRGAADRAGVLPAAGRRASQGRLQLHPGGRVPPPRGEPRLRVLARDGPESLPSRLLSAPRRARGPARCRHATPLSSGIPCGPSSCARRPHGRWVRGTAGEPRVRAGGRASRSLARGSACLDGC